jgi:hypothetical protein
MAHATAGAGSYALIADLPLQIEGYALEPLSQLLSAERIRRTTTIHLSGGGEEGGGEEGAGEDATPVVDEQRAFLSRDGTRRLRLGSLSTHGSGRRHRSRR